MNKLKNKYILFFFIVSFILPLHGQYLPKDGAKLNYNQIYFEYPFNKDAKFYTVYITFDSIANPTNKDFIIKQQEKSPLLLVKNLKLGKKYKWFVETTLHSNEKVKSTYFYFSILNTNMANPKLYKAIQHYNKKSKIQDGIIWCDQYRCAVDRDGNIVWFMATEQLDLINAKVVRDIKLYPDGSMTFVHQPYASRMDIDLNSIWTGPYKGTVSESDREDYHHAFNLLPNGNYMILGNEKVNFSNDTVTSDAVNFCNIIEFDATGKIVWSWRMKDYFPYEYLINSKIPTRKGIADPHANSFTIDEKNNVIYLSFRDISRIIKIDKKTKKILASYGAKLNDKDDVFETDLFRLQHDIQLLENNDFLIFNNNDIDSGKTSCVEIVHFPISKKDSFQLKWKFDLNYDIESIGKVQRMGGVKIMPNGNYLICEGSNNRVVEISQNKEILWDFALRQVDSTGNVNDKFALYRANYSSCLYPYYYGTIINGNDLTLFNKGCEDDVYKIELLLKNNSKLEIITETIKRNQSLKIKLPVTILIINKLSITSLKSGKQKEVNIK
jgi:hypothetical protein